MSVWLALTPAIGSDGPWLHPAVELSIVMADPIDSLPRLRAGELDMAISHDPLNGRGDEELHVSASGNAGAETPGDLDVVHLFDDPMYVAMPVGHPLAGVIRERGDLVLPGGLIPTLLGLRLGDPQGNQADQDREPARE